MVPASREKWKKKGVDIRAFEEKQPLGQRGGRVGEYTYENSSQDK